VSRPSLRLVVPEQTSRYMLTIDVTIVNVTELHVGGSVIDKMTSAMADNVVSKIYAPVYRGPSASCDGYVYEIVPVIPSSSIKGVLRTFLEDHVRMSSRSITLLEVLKKVIDVAERDLRDDEVAKDRVARDIVDRVLYRVLTQFLDESLAKHIYSIKSFSDLKAFIEAAAGTSIEGVAERLGLDRTGVGNYAAKVIVDTLKSFQLYKDVCYTVVEGLACELPLPLYKLVLLRAISEALNEEIEYPCRVCKYLGLPGYASRISITNAWPKNVDKAAILARTHIAIDRITGTVAQGKTFDVEYVAPGTEFEFFIVYRMHTKNLRTSLDEAKNRVKEFLDQDSQSRSEDSLREIGLHDYDIEILKVLKKFVNELKNGGIQIGGRKTWSYGIVKLWNTFKVCLFDLAELRPPREPTPREGEPKPLWELRRVFGCEDC